MGKTIPLSDPEKNTIRNLYEKGWHKGDGKFLEVATSLGRNPSTLTMYAKKIGLKNPIKSYCPSIQKKLRSYRKGIPNGRALTEFEKLKIKELYLNNFKRGDGSLKLLCSELDRHVATIVNYANSQGWSSLQREWTEKEKKKIGEDRKEWHLNNKHPRGMLGKKHSPQYCALLSERHKNWWKVSTQLEKNKRIVLAMKTKLKKYKTLSPFHPGKPVTWKQGWREVGERRIFFRSRWEANYGRYLELLKEKGDIKNWEHEPKTFWFPEIKRGTVTYLPDFKITKNDGSHYWVEVKGFMDARSKTKIRRFKKYFPEEKLVVIDKKWYYKNNKTLRLVIDEWEHDRI